MSASGLFLSRIRLVASKPSISGICTSIRTMSKGCFSNIVQSFSPILRQYHGVPPLLQKPGNQLLVYSIVFRHKKRERLPLLPKGVSSQQRSGFPACWVSRQNLKQDFTQFQPVEWFA